METTLILLKPDCIAKRHIGEVLSRFEKQGFHISGIKMMKLSTEILQKHYCHIAKESFFPSVQKFMQSSPIIALALSGENVIARVRELIGPTDSRKAAKGTIRGDLGRDVQENVVHASDSLEGAEKELARFFQPQEIFRTPIVVHGTGS